MPYLLPTPIRHMRALVWLPLLALGLALLAPASQALAAGDPTGCDDVAPRGWMRTTNWVTGARWSPSQAGPWRNGTAVTVQSAELSSGFCTSSGPGNAYTDGLHWWGSFRQDYVATGRGAADPAPFGRHRFARETWWSGWKRPAIGGQKVAGQWHKSTGASIGDESVFVANDAEIWTEIGAWSVEARCMSAAGPLVSVSFTAHNADRSWSASGAGTHWSVGTAAGPGPWAVTASGYGWSATATLSDGGTHVFVVSGCGSAGGTVTAEAHCGSPTGPLVNAGAFDAWEDDYWHNGGWYSSSGYGASATFSVPAGASTPLHIRVWWSGGSQAQASANVGDIVRFVTTDPTLCTSSSSTTTGPTPQPTPQGPCTDGSGPYDGSWIGVSALTPGGAGRLYEPGEGTELTPPQSPPSQVSVTPGQPLTLRLDYHLNGMAFSPGHDGRSRANWGLRDITSGQSIPLVEVLTDDERDLADRAGAVLVDAYSTKITRATFADGVGARGTGMWKYWQPNWGNWSAPLSRPAVNTFYVETTGATELTFTPQNGHTYELWAMAGHGACQIVPNQRWSRLQINARQADLLLLEVGMDGITKGPLAGQPVLYVASTAANPWQTRLLTTDGAGRVAFDTSEAAAVALIPGFAGYGAADVALHGWVLWKAQHTCTGAQVNYEGTYKGIAEIRGPCPVTLFYARGPEIAAAARKATSSTALAGVPITLADAGGTALAAATTDAGGSARFRLSEAELRPLIGARSVRWQLSSAPLSGALQLTGAVPGTSGIARADHSIQLSPVTTGNGHIFLYDAAKRSLTVSGTAQTASSAIDPDRPVAGAEIAIVARDAAGAPVATTVARTDAAGNYAAALLALPDDQSIMVEIRLAAWQDTTYADYVPDQAFPGTLSPADAGGAQRVDAQTIRVSLRAGTAAVSSAGNRFELINAAPPPQGPVAVRWSLLVRSRYDADRVHVAPGAEISWPEGETLNWVPRVALTPAPDTMVGGTAYRFDTTVIAWSFLGSAGRSAADTDALGRTGCRAQVAPRWDGADPAQLDGCAYPYDERWSAATPTAAELEQQALTFWSMRPPLDLEPVTFALRLERLQRVDLRVQALVRVQTVRRADPVTGTAEQPVGEPAYMVLTPDAPFYVNLIAPRSTQ